MVSLAFLCNRCKCHLTISAALVGALVGVCVFICFVCLNLYFSAVATAPVCCWHNELELYDAKHVK